MQQLYGSSTHISPSLFLATEPERLSICFSDLSDNLYIFLQFLLAVSFNCPMLLLIFCLLYFCPLSLTLPSCNQEATVKMFFLLYFINQRLFDF